MDTIISIVDRRIKDHPGKTVLKYKTEGVFEDVTWAELGEIIKKCGCAFLKAGVKIGDRVAIMSENRPEWAYADLAALSCGAVTVPIYTTSTPKEIEYILKDSGAEYIFVSTPDKLQKVMSVAGNTPLKRVISFEDMPNLDPLVIRFDKFIREENPEAYLKALEDRMKMLRQEDLVSIIYTSGSTGAPKGVMLTNRNFISNCRASEEAMRIGPDDRYLSFLPLSHVFERMAGYYTLLICGAEIAYAESRDTIMADARAVSPTLIYGVPRFFEKLYAGILNKVIDKGGAGKNMFFWGYRVGRACMLMRLRGKRPPFYLRIQKLLVTGKISKKLKSSFGRRLRFFVSGGAPLSKEVAYFFLSFDILILEGYGLTESSPVITVNRPGNYRVGTVGLPLEGVTVKIARDGEVLARGPNIMKGYFNPCGAADTAVEGGWLHTGDIGHLDKDGFLVITDRKKDIIVTSGGKNVAPSEIETLIKADRYIEDILVYGDKKKFISALIIPDFENLVKYAEFKNIGFKKMADLVKSDAIQEFIQRRIDEKQKDLPPFARVKKMIVLDKRLTQDRGELTPTLKIKRRMVAAKYSHMLDALYENDIK